MERDENQGELRIDSKLSQLRIPRILGKEYLGSKSRLWDRR